MNNEVISNGSVALTQNVSTEIVRELFYPDSQRSVLVVTNLEAAGGNTIFLSWDEEAAANKGLPLSPGQSWTESIDSGFKPSNRKVTGFTTGTPVSVAVHQRILNR